MGMKVAGLVWVLLAAAAATADARGEARPVGGVSFAVRNEAASTAGGKRFSAVIGEDYARRVLEEATGVAWELFHQDDGHRKPVGTVTLTVLPRIDGGRATSTREGHIELSAEWLAGAWPGTDDDARMATTGLLFHEVARVWQYNGDGHANAALVEGIADLVRLRGGYRAAGWVQPGQGDRWDQIGNGVTARFLEHLEKQRLGLVAAVNAGLKKQVSNGGVDLFKGITGKSVTQLWAEYKSVYAA